MRSSLLPSCVFVDTSLCAVWQSISNTVPFHNIWFDRQPWRINDSLVTRNGLNSYSYDPSITKDTLNILHVVYSQLPFSIAGNNWKIYQKRSINLGNTWSIETNITGNTIGYFPVIRASNNGKIYCVWSEFANDQWRISTAYSMDNGLTWSTPESLTSFQSFSLEPSLAVSGDTLYIAWQDYRNGNWDIYFKRAIIPATSIEEGTIVNSHQFRVQTKPNPFKNSIVINLPSIMVNDNPSPIQIYDVTGKIVKSFSTSNEQSFTKNAIIWNGKDNNDREVQHGIYFVRVKNPELTLTKKLVKIQ